MFHWCTLLSSYSYCWRLMHQVKCLSQITVCVHFSYTYQHVRGDSRIDPCSSHFFLDWIVLNHPQMRHLMSVYNARIKSIDLESSFLACRYIFRISAFIYQGNWVKVRIIVAKNMSVSCSWVICLPLKGNLVRFVSAVTC